MISEPVLIVIIFFLGSIIGSFLSCVIHRLYHAQKFVSERSMCPSCNTVLRWYELIPIVSFLVQRGRCRTCKSSIAIQDIVFEVVSGLLFVGVVLLRFSSESTMLSSVLIVRDWIFVSALLAIFVFDFRWQLIPDQISIPVALFALGANILFLVPPLSHLTGATVGLYSGIIQLLLAGLVGAGFFLLQFVVSRGKWIGGGDIRLGLVMGFMLGWPGILIALMVAYVMGAVISVLLVMFKIRSWKSPVPFGTFLTTATVIVLYWGADLVSWYVSLLS